MKNEFYQSKLNPFPTISRVLAVSLVGASAAVASNCHPIMRAGSGINPALRDGIERCAYSYYMEATEASDETTQAQALDRFAQNLLRETKDSPQSLVDTLNCHFWELI